MPVVDTSWLVALHIADDQYHERAAEQSRGESDLIIPDVVLGEFLNVVYVLAGGKRRRVRAAKTARAVLAGIEANAAFRIATDADPAETRRWYASNPSLSYVDAVGVRLAHEAAAGLLTFDRMQRQAYEARVKRSS